MKHKNSTVNPQEIAHFSQTSASWWDLEGPFAPLHRMTPTRMRFIKDTISGHFEGTPFAHLNILDIGCGGGLISEPLCRLGANVTGIDADESAIKVASQHAKAQNLKINYIAGAAENLAQKGQKFDVVLALEIVEHVQNPELFIELCSQLLKPNGVLILSTLNRTWKSYVLGIVAAEQILKWVPAGTHDWHKFIRPSELAHMSEHCHLNVKNLMGMKYVPFQAEFMLDEHDLDINYFLVATALKNKVK